MDPVGGEQRLTAEPRDVELPDGRQLLLEHLDQQADGLVVEDRPRLDLVAVGTVEVAAQAGHDRQRERRAVAGAGPVPALQEPELVEVAVDDHPAQRQVAQHLHRRRGNRSPGEEALGVQPVVRRLTESVDPDREL